MGEQNQHLIDLKASVFHSRFSEGVVFRGKESPVILRGENAHKLVTPILQQLRSGTSQAALIEKIPEQLRPVVSQLLNDLIENDLIRSRAFDDPKVERELPGRFRQLWEFLADNLQNPGQRLQAWIDQTFFIEGEAKAIAYMVRALAESAARNFVLAPNEGAQNLKALTDPILTNFPDIGIAIASDKTPKAEWQKIYVAGNSEYLTSASDLSDAWFVGRVRDHLIIAKSDRPLAKSIALWRGRMHPPAHDVANVAIPETRIALATCCAAFGLLCEFSGIGADDNNKNAWLLTARVGLKVVPIQLPSELQLHDEASAQDSFSDDDRLANLQCLLDPVTGFLDHLPDVEQVPLSVARYQLRGGGSGEDSVMAGWGLTHPAAQLEGLRHAIAGYLHRHPAIAGLDGYVGVGWAPDDALVDANRRRASDRFDPNAGDWTPVAPSDFDDPDNVRLAKLLGLLTGDELRLEEQRVEGEGTGALRCQVSSGYGAWCVGPERSAALRNVLGLTCMNYQLRDQSEWRRERPNTGVTRIAVSSNLWVDLGYPQLKGSVFCCVIGAHAE